MRESSFEGKIVSYFTFPKKISPGLNCFILYSPKKEDYGMVVAEDGEEMDLSGFIMGVGANSTLVRGL